MKISTKSVVKITFSKEDVKEAVVFWLSMSKSKSNTETCSIASYLNNDSESELSIVDGDIVLNFSTPEDTKIV